MIRHLACCALVCSASLFADSIVLRSGRTVDGTYLGGDSRNVRLAVGDRVESFDIGEISQIRFGSTATAQPPPAPAAAPPQAAVAQTPPAPPAAPPPPAERAEVLRPEPEAPASRAEAPAAPARSGAEVPAGTAIVIRLIDDVDSERDNVGKTYRASLDEAVVVNGETLIPRGADVSARLVDDQQSGKLTGKTVLTLDLDTITVNGRQIEVKTQEVTQESSSRTGRTAKVVGGTAALGAIIGAIAGGGKGAAVGAASGAAVGGAAQVITKGQRVRIPSETRLSFSTQQPIRI